MSTRQPGYAVPARSATTAKIMQQRRAAPNLMVVAEHRLENRLLKMGMSADRDEAP